MAEIRIRTDQQQYSYWSLYRYSTALDYLLITIGSVSGIGAGAVLPLMTIIFGSMTNIFAEYEGASDRVSPHEFQHQINSHALYFVYLAVATFVLNFTYTSCWFSVGERVSRRIKKHYIKAMVSQEISYYETIGAGELITRVTKDVHTIQLSTSEKIGRIFSAISTFVTAFVIAFIKSWKMTLILSCIIPAVVVISSLASVGIDRYSKRNTDALGRAVNIATDSISSISVVKSFSAENKMVAMFNKLCSDALIYGQRRVFFESLLMGFVFFLFYAEYGLAFWQGSRFLVRNEISAGDIVTVFFAVLIGAFSFEDIGPGVNLVSQGGASGAKIFQAIDRASAIDPFSISGTYLPKKITGNIRFRNVSFCYPSRPEIQILNEISLTIPTGKTTALVGASGCGKSSILQLIMRYYDPEAGSVFVDNEDLRDLNVCGFRQHVSMVAQDAALFSVSVFENIAYGISPSVRKTMPEETVRKLVTEACEIANADDFISRLSNGYDTLVGDKGSLLSGGQKQRIFIARAIIADAEILLLDEATSALDSRTESLIHKALHARRGDRTIVTVAHRLSTVYDADNIIVMDKGCIVEQGTHPELLLRKGYYYHMVMLHGSSIVKRDEVVRDKNEVTINNDRADDLDVSDYESSERVESGTEIQLKEQSTISLALRMTKYMVDDKYLMLLGAISSIVAGGAYPAQAILFAKVIHILSYPQSMYGALLHDVNYFSLVFFILAIVQLFANFSMTYFFGLSSERLYIRLRSLMFKRYTRMDNVYFDDKDHYPESLGSILASHPENLKGFSGATMATIIQLLTNLIGGAVLSLCVAWKLAVVTLSTLPLLLPAADMQNRLLSKLEDSLQEVHRDATVYAAEVVGSIKTVNALIREDISWVEFCQKVDAPVQNTASMTVRMAVVYGLVQSGSFCVNGLCFWYGGTLIRRREYSITQFFVCFIAITFGVQSMGQFLGFLKDISSAKSTSQEIFDLLDTKPDISIESADGYQFAEKAPSGISFDDVYFRYPMRRDVPVLNGLSFDIKPGSTVGIVGQSGCGKSTVISLIERFYSPDSGNINISGKSIGRYNINSLRSTIGLVTQEPKLFPATIRENVLLGIPEVDEISDDILVQACKEANVLQFIQSLPEGFNTFCGARGSMLSGGQRQRIALARAIVRRPQILLLDEATAALDVESEKAVKDALGNFAYKPTVISIAHRLNTIRDSDVILVIDQGRVVEQGIHQRLMEIRGRYFELVQQQQLTTA
ncbi:P-loop containing nucleoside triphosphate hydrolase [Lipomyces doorenjongii]